MWITALVVANRGFSGDLHHRRRISIVVEHSFVRHENESGERRLCDQHPIKRIAMWTGKAVGRLSVQHGDRQLNETLTC